MSEVPLYTPPPRDHTATRTRAETVGNLPGRVQRVCHFFTRFLFEQNQTFNLHWSTRVVKTDVYYMIRPLKRTPGTEVDWNTLQFWKFSARKGFECSDTRSMGFLTAILEGENQEKEACLYPALEQDQSQTSFGCWNRFVPPLY